MKAAAAFALGALIGLGCGGARTPPADPPPAPAPAPTAEAPTPDAAPLERACFTGSTENGVCEVFSAALEPLPALSAHCREAGGQWLETCPAAGRVGTCSGDGRRATYYGGALGPDAVRAACEREGHVFVP